jgi:hypothetical protein
VSLCKMQAGPCHLTASSVRLCWPIAFARLINNYRSLLSNSAEPSRLLLGEGLLALAYGFPLCVQRSLSRSLHFGSESDCHLMGAVKRVRSRMEEMEQVKKTPRMSMTTWIVVEA